MKQKSSSLPLSWFATGKILFVSSANSPVWLLSFFSESLNLLDWKHANIIRIYRHGEPPQDAAPPSHPPQRAWLLQLQWPGPGEGRGGVPAAEERQDGPQDVCQDREGAHEGDGATWQKSGSKHRRNVSFKFIQGAKLVVKYNLLNH